MRQGPSGQQRVLSILDPGSKLQINLISELGHLIFYLIDNLTRDIIQGVLIILDCLKLKITIFGTNQNI